MMTTVDEQRALLLDVLEQRRDAMEDRLATTMAYHFRALDDAFRVFGNNVIDAIPTFVTSAANGMAILVESIGEVVWTALASGVAPWRTIHRELMRMEFDRRYHRQQTRRQRRRKAGR